MSNREETLKLPKYKYIILSLIMILSLYSLTMKANKYSEHNIYFFSDSLVPVSKKTAKKSIYPEGFKDKSNLYNKLWGKHYRSLYSIPISVETITFDKLFGGVRISGQADDFHGLYLEDKKGRIYLLKPLGGSTSFLQSDFFQDMYNKTDFKDTYLDEFIGDAYTIINPYTFLATNTLAEESGLNTNNPQLYFLPPNETTDTIATGSGIANRLVSVARVPDVERKNEIIDTPHLLELLCKNSSYKVNQNLYIRERLFDILIGDWNKIPENWNWEGKREGNKVVFDPIVIDRNHAFTKVDGFLFKQMLNVLTLGFITNYEEEIKNIKKFNKLGFTLDVALTANSDESIWIQEAKYVQSKLTNEVIDEAFIQLPQEVKGEEIKEIIENLKKRRDSLESFAREYYVKLQENPVITATNEDDSIFLKKYGKDSLQINIIHDNETIFDRKYSKKLSKEVWIYGMDGNDNFIIEGSANKNIPTYLIGGSGNNQYKIGEKNNTRIFGYKDQKNELSPLKNKAKVILSDNEEVHKYDYQKTRYRNTSLTPWGVYDSDWGLSLGTFLTFTQYGFKREPFSYQHRIGYNYLQGFMYKGIFPMYDGIKSIYLDAFIGSPQNFSNFFGFGNNTDGFKNEKRKYNRVHVNRYSLSPSLHFSLDDRQKIILSSGIELFKVKRENNKYINLYFDEDNSVFKRKYFIDFGVGYEIERKISNFIPVFTASLTTGWKLNLVDKNKNFPYAQTNISFNFKFTDRLTLATNIKGKVLFNDKYEFYQSASTELRGYRDSRFIGRQSYFQFSDLRLDMGTIKNPFTPLKYGLFAGFDFGRVWYPGENSKKWHTSYGGGGWITIINKITTKYSFFGSSDSFRFMFGLGLGF